MSSIKKRFFETTLVLDNKHLKRAYIKDVCARFSLQQFCNLGDDKRHAIKERYVVAVFSMCFEMFMVIVLSIPNVFLQVDLSSQFLVFYSDDISMSQRPL